MITVPMPSGVEHLTPSPLHTTRSTMITVPMPSGVEHPVTMANTLCVPHDHRSDACEFRKF